MKMLFSKKIISVFLVVSLMFTIFVIPSSAIDVSEMDTSTYLIEVDGTTYHVTVTPNANGTKLITVVNENETISWTTAEFVQEGVSPADTRMTGSYSSYRYIYSSAAANVWNLYRPLQADGDACSKGVSYDSAACRNFAAEVEAMKAAEVRVNQYLADEDLANTFGAQLLLSGAGGAAGFLVAQSLIASTIAGMVGYIISTYAIPFLWEAAIEALVEAEYHNIRSSMIDANYYFEIA